MVNINTPVRVGRIAKRVVYQLSNRTSLVISNMSDTATLYYGGDNSVSINNGIPIRPSTTVSFLQGIGDRPDLERWLISDAENTDVRIGEEVEKEREIE